MSSPKPSGSDERGRCERCLAPKATSLQDWLDNGGMDGELCGDHVRGSPAARIDCRDRTIARIRQELAVRDERIGRLEEQALRAIEALLHTPPKNNGQAQRNAALHSAVAAVRKAFADDAARGKETGA